MNTSNIVGRLQEIVRQHGSKNALKCPKSTYTYREMDTKANKVSNDVKEICTIQSRVALLLPHECSMVIGMVGALKAGTTIVPLDASYPNDRLEKMIKDAGVTAIITDDAGLEQAHELLYRSEIADLEIINIDECDAIEKHESEMSDGTADACILYTSGSTGIPKGVRQTHANVLHFVDSFSSEIDICDRDCLLLTTPYNHAVAILDIFSTLLAGGCLYIYDVKEDLDIDELTSTLLTHNITILHTVPTFFRFLNSQKTNPDDFKTIRLVVLGGEDVYQQDVEDYKILFSPDCHFVNLYGQTEILAAAMDVFDKESKNERGIIPIGFPLDDLTIELRDEEGNEPMVLKEGEMIVVSEYITPGYLNQETFDHETIIDGKRAIRTGDLAKRLPNGKLEYIGRKDSTVKINGNRVDLQEIELHLNALSSIKSAVVIYRKELNVLAAFLEKSDSSQELIEVKDHLRKFLPEFMIPTHFEELETMPLTSTGKIDRSQLNTRSLTKDQKIERGHTDTEKVLMKIWKEVFDKNDLSISDNFFQLGGNSLIATELVNKVYMELGLELELNAVFDHQTILDFAKLVDKQMVH